MIPPCMHATTFYVNYLGTKRGVVEIFLGTAAGQLAACIELKVLSFQGV